MLGVALTALAVGSAADDYTTKLPNNMSLVVPFDAATWRDGLERMSKALGGKAAAVAIFCSEDDVQAFGPIANTLARQLGGERAVFVAAILNAESGTIGDDSLSLPHVLLVLPDGKGMPWAEWLPNMYTPRDRLSVAQSLASWVAEHIDECADAGICHDALDESKAAVVRARVQEDLKKQAGEARSQQYAARQTVELKQGQAVMGEEDLVGLSELQVPREHKRKAKKRRKKRPKEEL